MHVDRCICFDVPLAEVVRLAREGHSLRQISEATGCCQGCGMCEPYCHVAIRTGQASVPLLSPLQVDRELRQAKERPAAGLRRKPIPPRTDPGSPTP